MGRASSARIVVVALLLFGCSGETGSAEEQGTRRVMNIGAPGLVGEATILRKLAPAGATVPVGPSQWTPAIKELQPQEVRVTPQSVYVQRVSRGGWEESVFVAFPGTMVETRVRGTRPLFSRIDGQVYWYQVEG